MVGSWWGVELVWWGWCGWYGVVSPCSIVSLPLYALSLSLLGEITDELWRDGVQLSK